ncbi:hypothetical protein RM704_34800, partial [Streptomyces sp. DSM 3412]
MSTHTVEKLVVRESGWAEARRRREKGVRLCLPALTDRDGNRRTGFGTDEHIVRGDDYGRRRRRAGGTRIHRVPP